MSVAIAVPGLEIREPSSATRALDDRQADTISSGVGRLPELALIMAMGSALIAAAFAGGRSGRHWAGDLFWIGQVVIYAVPAGFLLCRKRILRAEAVGVAVLMPVISYLVNQYYSPGQFRFADEFDHVQTAQTILAEHHLFQLNTVLPQSSQYPGLEIITTSIASITHLSITSSGLVLSGVAHVLVGLGLYLLIVEITGRDRVAALAVVIYATGPHYQFFDSYFIYETIAIPFLLLCLLATAKMMTREGSVSFCWAVVAVACGAVTAVSHHVTSYMLIALLFAFAVAQLFLPRSNRSRGLLPVVLIVTGIVAIWDLGIATATVSYFRPVIDTLLQGHSATTPAVKGSLSVKPGVTGQSPRTDTIAEYLAFLVLLVLTIQGALSVWRIRRSFTSAAPLGMAIASLSIILVLAIREVATNGSELATRTLTFALLPISFVSATLLVNLATGHSLPKHRRHRQRLRLIYGYGGALLIVVLALGDIAGGWPPFYA